MINNVTEIGGIISLLYGAFITVLHFKKNKRKNGSELSRDAYQATEEVIDALLLQVSELIMEISTIQRGRSLSDSEVDKYRAAFRYLNVRCEEMTGATSKCKVMISECIEKFGLKNE